MTFMSTHLDGLVRKGELLRFEVDLGPRRLPIRQLYVTKGFAQWASTLPSQVKARSRLVSHASELQETAASFIAGDPIVTLMKSIMPTKHGVLRLQTASLYLVGWANGYQSLTLAAGISKQASHVTGALAKIRNATLAERTRLNAEWSGKHFYELFQFKG